MNKRTLLLMMRCSTSLLTGRASEIRDLAYDRYLSGYDYPFEVQTFAFESQGKSLNMTFMVLKGRGRPAVGDAAARQKF